jgi:hypothetical protein
VQPKRLACFGSALLPLVAISACGDGEDPADVTPTAAPPVVSQGISSSPDVTEATSSPPAAVPTSPAATTKPAGPPQLKVGGTFVGQRSKITIRSAKLGGSAADYEPGTVWLYTDVRICNTGTEALNTPSWSMWLLKTQDGYEVEPADITPEPRQPALPYERELAPDDCVRGWLTFAPPKDSRTKEIRLIGDDVSGSGSVIASWKSK